MKRAIYREENDATRSVGRRESLRCTSCGLRQVSGSARDSRDDDRKNRYYNDMIKLDVTPNDLVPGGAETCCVVEILAMRIKKIRIALPVKLPHSASERRLDIVGYLDGIIASWLWAASKLQ